MMRRTAFTGVVVSAIVAAAPTARAGFALADQDRVVFFGERALLSPEMPMGVETFIRIRYPELKPAFRTFARSTPRMLKDALQRFESEVVPYRPTVIVLCMTSGDVPRRPVDEAALTRFRTTFDQLVGRAAETATKVYVMTPMAPEPAKAPDLDNVMYEKAIGQYADLMREVAAAHGAKVIDWFEASRAYRDQHTDNRHLAITTDGAFPTTLGYAVGMAEILDAWEADPVKINVEADWKSEAVSASTGQASVSRSPDGKMLLKLSGMPIPWIVPKRGAVVAANWPCSHYYSLMLRIANVPQGGIMISEVGGKNPLPYLSQQLTQGADVGFLGPLTKTDAVNGLGKWIDAKYKAVARSRVFAIKDLPNPPEPEYQESYETFYRGYQQYVEATDRVVLRQPRTIDTTLELSAVPIGKGARKGAPDPGASRSGRRQEAPVQLPTKKERPKPGQTP